MYSALGTVRAVPGGQDQGLQRLGALVVQSGPCLPSSSVGVSYILCEEE